MTRPDNNLFTANQIASAIGQKRQAVQRSFAGIAPSGLVIVQGTQASAWSVTAMPGHLQEQLAAVARRLGFRDSEQLLNAPANRWEPALPLGAITQPCINSAEKLRRALGPVLEQSGAISGREMEWAGLEAYTREFGHSVTARYLRKLIRRTIERDGGAGDWGRLEIYLPERPARREARAIAGADSATDFAELVTYLGLCGHPPSEIEQRGVWTLAFERYGQLVRDGHSPKQAARSVREFLFTRASFLAPSRDALLKAFERKLQRWHESGGDAKTLRDRRESNGASFELPDGDRDLLIHRAVFYYRGDMAPAWRDMVRQGFSEAVRTRYAGKAASKSHVPASVRDSIATEVEILTVMHQGPRAFDQIKGHVERSYEGIASRKCMVADDFTMPVYFLVPDGKGWFFLTRGQILIFIDFRTLRVLGWSLQPDRNYSSLTIRSLCTHVFAEHGVPSVLQFERGIWESSSLIKGRESAALGFSEVAQGLREFGIRFIHSIRARSKTVERVGGLLQDLMEAEPGYCGREERKDAPESLRKQMAAAEARKPGSLQNFYTYEQWNRRFGEIVNQYNAEPQQGKILAGLSPDDAFSKFADPSDPPMDFSGAVRYLLAHDKRPARVTLNGVTIRIGKKEFNYRGQEIAHLVNREVLAWLDPENPEILTVTDMDRQNPICVARSNSPSALECLIDPGSETLGRELKRIEDQASYIKTRFTVLKSKFPMPQRKTLVDARTLELGADIAAQKETLNREQKQQAKTQRTYSRLQMAVPSPAARRPGTVEAAERLHQLLSEEETT